MNHWMTLSILPWTCVFPNVPLRHIWTHCCGHWNKAVMIFRVCFIALMVVETPTWGICCKSVCKHVHFSFCPASACLHLSPNSHGMDFWSLWRCSLTSFLNIRPTVSKTESLAVVIHGKRWKLRLCPHSHNFFVPFCSSNLQQSHPFWLHLPHPTSLNCLHLLNMMIMVWHVDFLVLFGLRGTQSFLVSQGKILINFSPCVCCPWESSFLLLLLSNLGDPLCNNPDKFKSCEQMLFSLSIVLGSGEIAHNQNCQNEKSGIFCCPRDGKKWTIWHKTHTQVGHIWVVMTMQKAKWLKADGPLM